MPGRAIVLIGPMASGKSRTGKRLAQRLGLPFVDTDRRIEEQVGPISAYFASHGEASFRAIERDVVADAVQRGGVIATGGGAVLEPSTQALLEGCLVAYLSISAEAAALRLAGDTKRPLLHDGGIERWSAIYEERRAVYERLGTIHIDTSHRPMEAIADELAAWVRSRTEGEQS